MTKTKPPPRIQALDVLQRPPHLNDKDFDHIVALRPRAKRFVFDRDASRHLGHFIRECGDLLIANRQFAIPPFETTYIELELDDMLKALGQPTTAVNPHFAGTAPDTKIGYLLHKREVYPIAFDDAKQTGLPGVFRYETDTPSGSGPIFDEPVIIGDRDDEWARMLLLLGTTQEHVPDEETRLDIIRSVRIKLIDHSVRSISRMQRRHQVMGTAGDLRNVWAALLLLNQQRRKGVSFQEVPWQAALHKGKRKVFATHSVVKIHLAPKQTIASMMRPGLHVPRPAHDVAGHFAHWNLHEGCIHEWPPLPDLDGPPDQQGRSIPRWHCGRCNGLRVWRKDYRTGDATIGFTTTEYRVTP